MGPLVPRLAGRSHGWQLLRQPHWQPPSQPASWLRPHLHHTMRMTLCDCLDHGQRALVELAALLLSPVNRRPQHSTVPWCYTIFLAILWVSLPISFPSWKLSTEEQSSILCPPHQLNLPGEAPERYSTALWVQGNKHSKGYKPKVPASRIALSLTAPHDNAVSTQSVAWAERRCA